MGRTGGETSPSGALGPLLAEAITDYNSALTDLDEARARLELAERAVAATRARLSALAAGARITGAKALVAVEASPDE